MYILPIVIWNIMSHLQNIQIASQEQKVCNPLKKK